MPTRSTRKQPADITPNNPRAKSNRAHSARWRHAELLDDGYVPVPVEFLRHYAQLKPYSLTSGEALFVIHLMEFKWDSNAPFPSYKTLAMRMGVSDKMARRHAQSLEQKGYLQRIVRVGQTNRFNLTPLFNALRAAVIARRGSIAVEQPSWTDESEGTDSKLQVDG